MPEVDADDQCRAATEPASRRRSCLRRWSMPGLPSTSASWGHGQTGVRSTAEPLVVVAIGSEPKGRIAFCSVSLTFAIRFSPPLDGRQRAEIVLHRPRPHRVVGGGPARSRRRRGSSSSSDGAAVLAEQQQLGEQDVEDIKRWICNEEGPEPELRGTLTVMMALSSCAGLRSARLFSTRRRPAGPSSVGLFSASGARLWLAVKRPARTGRGSRKRCRKKKWALGVMCAGS